MYQQITLVGNLGSDPDLRFTPQGVAVCDFRVAVNKQWTTPGGEKSKETVWFRVTCWRGLAENVAKFMKKGRQVMIVGEINVSAYLDKEGKPAATLELTAQQVKFLGGNPGDSGDSDSGSRPSNNRTPQNDAGDADIPF